MRLISTMLQQSCYWDWHHCILPLRHGLVCLAPTCQKRTRPEHLCQTKSAYPVNLVMSKSAHPNLSVGLVGLYMQQGWTSQNASLGADATGRGPQKLSPWLKRVEARSYHQPESQALDQALHPTFVPLLREKQLENAPQWNQCLLYSTQIFAHVQHPNFRFKLKSVDSTKSTGFTGNGIVFSATTNPFLPNGNHVCFYAG